MRTAAPTPKRRAARFPRAAAWVLMAAAPAGGHYAAAADQTTVYVHHVDTTLIAGGTRFTSTDGEKLFTQICQGCHMPDARGATGAGTYPALAHNPKLKSAAYPEFMVVNGLRSMPSFAGDLNDAQIAAVVNYVITHFGNHATALATAQQVKALRAAR
jgi:mono/diheme cytochrome c family protein